MRFENGMLGLCISIVAIMGMVLSGFVLSVDAREVQTTTYDYVTDISGLFEYSQDPTFIDYNPSANWSGYYTESPDVTGGITYTSQTVANSYPIRQASTTTGSGTAHLDDLDLSQLSPPVIISSPQSAHQWGIVFDREPATSGTPTFDVPSPGVATLQTLIDALELPPESNSITFTLGSTDESPIIIPNTSWIYRLWQPPVSSKVEAYTASYYRDSGSVASVTIDLESGVATGYDAAGAQLWRESAAMMCIVYGGIAPSSSAHQWNLDTEISYVAQSYPDPIYMDISQGVGIDGSSNWQNGELNGRIDILFRIPNLSASYGNTFSIPLGDIYGTPTGQTMELEVYAYNGVRASLSLGEAESNISIGNWRAFVVSLDFVDGDYRIIPVTDFVSFTTYSEVSGSSQQFDIDADRCTAGGMEISTTSTSFRMGVVETSVFLDTYDAVMIDPSLDVSDYFTDLGDVRLNLFSFALYGDSMTINGQEFEVDGENRITVQVDDGTGGTESLALTLTNIYITFQGADTYLTFVNDGITADLGPTITTEISFSGIWYFTTGLYEGYQSTETSYDWSYDSFAFDSNGAIVAFLGILSMGTIVGARSTRQGMGVLDYIVVALAALCALTLVIL